MKGKNNRAYDISELIFQNSLHPILNKQKLHVPASLPFQGAPDYFKPTGLHALPQDNQGVHPSTREKEDMSTTFTKTPNTINVLIPFLPSHKIKF